MLLCRSLSKVLLTFRNRVNDNFQWSSHNYEQRLYLHISAIVFCFRDTEGDVREDTESSSERRSSAAQKTRAVLVLPVRRIFLSDKMTDTAVNQLNIILASIARSATFSFHIVTAEHQ